MAAIATPPEMQRNKSGRRRGNKYEERHPGHRQLWRRLNQFWEDLRRDHPEDWHKMIPRAANEAHGSQIGQLFIAGKLSVPEAQAGRYYAILAGQFDHYMGIAARSARSAAYERSYGRDDEVERRMRDGSIAAYERRAKRVKRKWRRIQDKLAPEVRAVLDRVCIEDRPPGFGEFPILKAGLAIIGAPMERGLAKMRSHHQPGAKLSSRKRGGRATWTKGKATSS